MNTTLKPEGPDVPTQEVREYLTGIFLQIMDALEVDEAPDKEVVVIVADKQEVHVYSINNGQASTVMLLIAALDMLRPSDARTLN